MNKSSSFEVIMVLYLYHYPLISLSMELYFRHLALGHLNKMASLRENTCTSSMQLEHFIFKEIFLFLFRGECILTTGYLINHTPDSVLHGKIPYEVLHGRSPSYNHLRVFGSLCYAHNQGTKGDTFASRSQKCVFVGYSHGKKG